MIEIKFEERQIVYKNEAEKNNNILKSNRKGKGKKKVVSRNNCISKTQT